MKTIVCGAGEVGRIIARHLTEAGNQVILVDDSAERLQKAASTVDVESLEGLASFPDVLERAGAASADMLIAVTRSDEVNMIACQVASNLFDVETKIARVSEPRYLKPEWATLFGTGGLPIDEIISPEREVAEGLVRRVAVPGASDSVSFANDRVQLVGLKLGPECPVLDTPLAQLTELFPDLDATVVYIIREEKGLFPEDSERMAAGDEVYIVAKTERMARVLAAFGKEADSARRIVIVGGGRLGTRVAIRIEETEPNARVHVIEVNKERADRAEARLNNARVFQGNILDEQDVREDADLSGSDMVLAVTESDETNTLVSVMSKQRYGCAYAAAVIHGTAFGSIIRHLGIDAVISHREVTISKILRYVHRGRVRAVHTVHDGNAEALEIEALESSELVGTPLRDLNPPHGLVIGAIVRGEGTLIPRGGTVIKAGDRVIAFVSRDTLKEAEKLFSVGFGFF